MRFLELHAKNYGPLRGKSFELQADVFVVYGPNEAGKSSFHNALRTTLYGFEKTKRADHPLAQFGLGEGNLELEATLRLDNGSEMKVQRTLMSYSKLTVTDAQGSEVQSAQRNETLRAIGSIPKDLFDAVYSLTANDTAMQTDDVRGHIQELLLGETGLRGARPMGEVRRKLADDIQGLWRSDLIGKPKYRQLQADLKDARKTLREAKSEERERRDKARTKLELDVQEAQWRREIGDLKATLERLRYRQEWREYRAKTREAQKISRRLAELDPALLETTVQDPSALASEIQQLEAELEPHRNRLGKTPIAPTEQQALWLARESRIEEMLADLSDREGLLGEGVALEEDLKEKTDRLRQSLKEMGIDAQYAKAFKEAPIAQLRLQAEQWEDLTGAHHAQLETKTPSPLWIPLTLLALGCTLGAVMLPAYAWPFFAGTALCLAGAIYHLLVPSRRPNIGPAPAMPSDSRATLESIGLNPGAYASPTSLTRLAEELRRTIEDWSLAREADRRLRACQKRIQDQDQRWAEDAAKLGVAQEDPGWPRHLAGEWKRCMQLGQSHQIDRRERVHAEEHQASLEQRLDQKKRSLAQTKTILNTAFPDLRDPGRAHQAWQEFSRLQVETEQDLIRLRSNPLYREEMEGPDFDLDDCLANGNDLGIRECEQAIEEYTAKRESALRELGSIEAEMKAGARFPLAAAAEAVRHIQEKQAQVLREHDRLALLGHVLARAEATYREKNQPDVLKRAGEYLAHITEGRYTSLRYPDAGLDLEESPELEVHSAELGWRRVSKPLSRGTQEQIYLSLRLGTLDYLDASRERLPLILDEALVHWDEGRRCALYKTLGELAAHRQVILFTCHRSFAEEVQESLDARLIDLTPKRVSST